MNPTSQMTERQRALWARLEEFSPDEPGALLPFSRRLARENGWTPAHARRAIGEYKRFVFLALEAGHPVSPSEAVDQVWHLHLVYTESYWQKLCGEVCGRRLHHQPTQGGGDEARKFDAMYARTLESYRRFFGEEPPADLWTPAEERNHGAPAPHRWVDLSRHWVLPKRAVAPLALVALAVPALLWLGGCEGKDLNVLDLRGPDFLEFFAVALVIGFIAAEVVRRVWCGPHGQPRDADLQLDAYEMAYLAGGGARVLHAALASLASAELVTVRGREPPVAARAKGKGTAEGRHEVELALWQTLPSAGTEVPLQLLQDGLRPVAERIEARLVERGLISPEARMAARMATAVALVVPVLGVVKIFVGLARGRPVSLLVFFLVVAVAVTVFLSVRWHRQRRSGLGTRVLRQLRARHKTDKHAEHRVPRGGVATPAMATALFGLAVLPALGLGSLAEQLRSRQFFDGDMDSGCGSSCGGGGGCGSGCGGCGGGGD